MTLPCIHVITNFVRIKENLIFDMKNILSWFRKNSLKANAGKFQFTILNQQMVINSVIAKKK